MRRKITVIGAGPVGSATALLLARRPDADVRLLDADTDRARARATDLAAATALGAGASGRVSCAGWAEASGSEVVVVAVGGDDPVGAGRAIGAEIARRTPDAVVVVLTTPVDEVTRAVLATSRLPRNRVVGLGTVVDSARLRAALAAAAEVDVRDVHAHVLGAHGGVLVPLTSAATIGGRAAIDVVGSAGLDAALAQVTAAEDLDVGQGPGGGLLAPAAGVAAIVAAILDDTRRLLTCSVLCRGEFGLEDAVTAVPAIVGAGGVGDVVELAMEENETAALHAAALR